MATAVLKHSADSGCGRNSGAPIDSLSPYDTPSCTHPFKIRPSSWRCELTLSASKTLPQLVGDMLDMTSPAFEIIMHELGLDVQLTPQEFLRFL